VISGQEEKTSKKEKKEGEKESDYNHGAMPVALSPVHFL